MLKGISLKKSNEKHIKALHMKLKIHEILLLFCVCPLRENAAERVQSPLPSEWGQKREEKNSLKIIFLFLFFQS